MVILRGRKKNGSACTPKKMYAKNCKKKNIPTVVILGGNVVAPQVTTVHYYRKYVTEEFCCKLFIW